MIVVDTSLIACAFVDDGLDGEQSSKAPYDAAYVALADALGAPLLTADRRLAEAPGLPCETILLN